MSNYGEQADQEVGLRLVTVVRVVVVVDTLSVYY